MIKIICLSKETEDCFLLEIEIREDKVLRILIDGGKNYKYIQEYFYKIIEDSDKSFDYFIDYIIVTHIDNDHIKGILKMYKDDRIVNAIDNAKIIYNKIVDIGDVSFSQAEEFENLIKNKKIIVTYKRNFQNSTDNQVLFFSKEKRFDKVFLNNLKKRNLRM